MIEQLNILNNDLFQVALGASSSASSDAGSMVVDLLQKRSEGFLRGGKGPRGERRLGAFHGALLWLCYMARRDLETPFSHDRFVSSVLSIQFDEAEAPNKPVTKKGQHLQNGSMPPVQQSKAVLAPSYLLCIDPVSTPVPTQSVAHTVQRF